MPRIGARVTAIVGSSVGGSPVTGAGCIAGDVSGGVSVCSGRLRDGFTSKTGADGHSQSLSALSKSGPAFTPRLDKAYAQTASLYLLEYGSRHCNLSAPAVGCVGFINALCKENHVVSALLQHCCYKNAL